MSGESTPLDPVVNNPLQHPSGTANGAICDAGPLAFGHVSAPTNSSGAAGGAIGERVQPPSRFESKPTDFVGIAGPTLVYIGVAKREDFDKIAVACVDDGGSEQGHVLTKTVGGFRASEVTVVFQHWLKQKTIEAMIADMEAKRK